MANPVGYISANVAAVLTGGAPVTSSAVVDSAVGGDVVAGTVGVSFPAAALAGRSGRFNVTVQAQPAGETVPGGPFQYSPNGSIASVAVTEQSGAAVTGFAAPITIFLRYNAADLAMARFNSGILTAAYQVGAATPASENPNGYPAGTWVLYPGGNVSQDLTAGTITIQTTKLGSILSVFTQPVGYVRTLTNDTREYSGWGQAAVLASRPKGVDLQVVQPQTGGRLFVLDPLTSNYAYVDASAVGPSEVRYDQVSQGHSTTATVGIAP